MPADISPEFAERLRSAYYIWFTTVRGDGMPQPTPVWFIWDGDAFLIYTVPTAQKVRNIRKNPKVALGYSASDDAGDFVVIMGEAKIEDGAPLANQVPAYVEKYSQGFIDIGMTADSMARMFSTAIRVTPIHVRGE